MSRPTRELFEGIPGKMLFHRRKATQYDVSGICRVYYSAFMTTSLGRQIMPRNIKISRPFWEDAFREAIADANTHIYVITDPGSKTPREPIAFAKWIAPGASIPEATTVDCFPESPNAKLAHDFSMATTKAHHLWMEENPHWYLESLYVMKEYIGMGAASTLIRWGTERADREKMPCYLDSLDMAAPIYEHFGFRVVGAMEFESEGGSFAAFSMVRDAVTQGAK